MSINTKLSLSKRLRRVFSMSSLSSKANDSTVSLQSQMSEHDISPKPTRSSTASSFVASTASQQQTLVDAAYSESASSSIIGPQPLSSISSPAAKPSARRRSIVSLSNIFSRNNSSSGVSKQKAQQAEPTVATVIVPAQTGSNQRHSTSDLRKIIHDSDKTSSPQPTTNRSPAERPKVDTSLASIQQQPSKGSLKRE
jgi:hypothetical protein